MKINFRWLQYFPKNRFHIVNSENFVQKPWEELQKVEKFLNLTSEINKKDFYFDEEKHFYCINRPYKHCMSPNKGHNNTNLISAENRKKLSDCFRPSNKKLYDLLGVDFNWQ